MLRVRLFGGLALESDGVALPQPERRRACSLLGWLALHPGMHPRSEVAGRFWPDVLDSSAARACGRSSSRSGGRLARRPRARSWRHAPTSASLANGVRGRQGVRASRARRAAAGGCELDGGELLAASTRTGCMRPASGIAGVSATCSSAWPPRPRRSGALDDAIGVSRRRIELDPLREDAPPRADTAPDRRRRDRGRSRLCSTTSPAACIPSSRCRRRERPVAFWTSIEAHAAAPAR
jgi:hypothetical protein